MLRDAAVDIIKRGLGFLQGKTHDEAIAAALQEAQAAREGGRSLPWFLLQEDETLALTADTPSYNLPSGFIREDVDYNPVLVISEEGTELPIDPLPYDEAFRLYEQAAEGAPEVYSIRKDQVWLFPTPDEAFTLQWSYFKADTLLQSNVENQWLIHAPYVLIADAGLRVATDLRDQEATAIFQSRKAEWDAWYTRQMTAQREANTRYVVGKYN